MTTDTTVTPINSAERKDKDGQEKVITLDPLRKKLQHLESLKSALDTAKADFSDAVTAVAEECGLMSAVVKKFIRARSSDSTADESRKAGQLSLLLDEFAEANAQATTETQH